MSGVHTRYLTHNQLDAWDLMRRGISQSQISRKLHISRQAVNKMVETIPSRVAAALKDTASLNRIEPRYLGIKDGVLVGWSKDFQTEAIISLTPEEGLQIWYQHNFGKCKICPDRRQCRSVLLKTAKRLEISLTRDETRLDPSDLSGIVFSRISERKSV